jgi:hypothetical protein
MATRSLLLPAATLALALAVDACRNEPTSAALSNRGLEASVVGPGPASLNLHPVAGNFPPPAFDKETGNATYAQAQWTNKMALDDKFSVLLQKSVDFASCYTSTPENGCAAFAAAVVNGVEGMTITELGTIGFSVNGTCGAGTPRFNLYFDADGDGQADGVAFYGCAAHISGTPAPGWTSMSTSAAAPDFCYSFADPTSCPLAGSTVVQLSVLVDEMGTWYIDRVVAAGNTTGEPNGR